MSWVYQQNGTSHVVTNKMADLYLGQSAWEERRASSLCGTVWTGIGSQAKWNTVITRTE